MIGFYGDDFTGSVDALLQFRRAGLRGELVTSPDAARHVDADVVGIAGVARSLTTDLLEAEVRPALEALRDRGCDSVLYKVCSTADSSPEVGSMGRAIEIGREVFGPAAVPLLVAQPDFGRWTVFGTHFAREDGAVHRLDRHPTMSRHPSTPMTEADLRLHVAAQTSLGVSGIDVVEYTGSTADLTDLIARRGDVVVLDALEDAHLTLLGEAVLGLPTPRFVVGSGGLALGLGRAVGGSAPPLRGSVAAVGGPVLVVSGSCSRMSWAQAQAALAAGWVGVPVTDQDAPAAAADAVLSGRHVVAYTSTGTADPAVVDVGPRLVEVVRAVVRAVPPARVVVAGGDTSGEVLRLLDARSVSILAAPWGNLPLLRVAGGVLDGLEVVLKGGQVGARDAYLAIANGVS